MPIDLKQLQQSFIEESIEMLDNMEKSLLKLDCEAVDEGIINELFRTIHSLKSSSAIFDFNSIKDFSHILENILDLIRLGTRKISEQDIDLFLKSVDCLRDMIADIQSNRPIDERNAKELQEKFREDKETSMSEISAGLKIFFRPERHFWEIKEEPYRLFRALSQLGKMDLKVDTKFLPPFGKFNPEDCYLAWNINLIGDIEQEEVREVFEWVTNKENLEISFLETTPELKKEIFKEKNKEKISRKILKRLSGLNRTRTTIRVSTEKVDQLINTVGELVITQSALRQVSKDLNIKGISKLKEELEHLDLKSRELQESAMRIRMIPIGFAFNRLPRLVKELSNKLGKQVDLIITGEETELDRTMMEKIIDPLMHLVRNAIDHGIETAEEREQIKKPKIGTLRVSAYQQKGCIVIDVMDDGNGLNKEKIRTKGIAKHLINENDLLSDGDLYQLIFQPGFSTAEQVTDVSGRGVGMDVVFKNIHALGGTLEIQSKGGEGTLIQLILPLTLAIMDCQLVKICNQIYVIPLISITGITKIDKNNISHLGEETEFYFFGEAYVPIVRLSKIFSLSQEMEDLSEKFIIIVSVGNRLFGFIIDEFLSQQQVVIKNFEENYRKISGIAGATIFGDGSIALIIDPSDIVEMTKNPERRIQRPLIEPLINQDLNSEEVDVNITQLLTFFMRGEEYGVNILEVNDIRSWIQPTALPNVPSYIQGVINQRGTIVPVIDLRHYFELGSLKYGPDTSVIILTVKGEGRQRIMGVAVDAVSDTYQLKDYKVLPVPDCHKSILMKHVRGLVSVADKMITLLSTNDLLPIEK